MLSAVEVVKTGGGNQEQKGTMHFHLFDDLKFKRILSLSFNGRITMPQGLPEYSSNNDALAAGLIPEDLYRTGDILKIVH